MFIFIHIYIYVYMYNTYMYICICIYTQASAAERGWKIRFDPPTPQSAMVHVYLEGDLARLEERHDRVRATTGVRVCKLQM